MSTIEAMQFEYMLDKKHNPPNTLLLEDCFH